MRTFSPLQTIRAIDDLAVRIQFHACTLLRGTVVRRFSFPFAVRVCFSASARGVLAAVGFGESITLAAHIARQFIQ